MASFSLIAFQEEVINQLNDVEANGVGLHKKRSRAAVLAKSRASLRKVGYSEKAANNLVNDAYEMWRLESICQEAEV